MRGHRAPQDGLSSIRAPGYLRSSNAAPGAASGPRSRGGGKSPTPINDKSPGIQVGHQGIAGSCIDNSIAGGYTEGSRRALPADGQPLIVLQEVTAQLGNWGRLLLFCYLDDQTDDAKDHETELKQLRVCDHRAVTPSRWRGQEVPSLIERSTAYRCG